MIKQFYLTLSLTSTTAQSQCAPGCNGSERVLYIIQSSRIGASPLDGLVSYLGHLGTCITYSTIPADMAGCCDW